MDRISQVLSRLDILVRQPVVPPYLRQESVQRLQVVFGRSGQVGEGGVQLPQSGESLVARLRDVLQTLAQVVTVVLCQATEPPGSGELDTFLFQRENIFTCGRNRF